MFLLADVTFDIIRVDFLCSYKLLINPLANCLVDTASLQSFATVSGAASIATVSCTASIDPSLLSLESAVS